MSVFHVRRGQKYHTENSLRGIRTAKRRGYTEIDLDMLITKDNRIVGCHWRRPLLKDGFRDPKKKLGRNRTVATMTLLEVTRLRAGRWPRTYRIQTIERLLRECARLGIGAVLEPKDDSRFALDWPWEHISKVADDCGAHVRVYGFDLKNIQAAQRAGFRAKELT